MAEVVRRHIGHLAIGLALIGVVVLILGTQEGVREAVNPFDAPDTERSQGQRDTERSQEGVVAGGGNNPSGLPGPPSGGSQPPEVVQPPTTSERPPVTVNAPDLPVGVCTPLASVNC